MSVSQAQSCVSSAEFSEWIAFHNLEPFTVDRTENMLSIIAAILANTHRKKGSRPYEPEDFLPHYGKKEVQTGDQMEIKLRAILHGHNQ